jgi:hypothetical protein
MFGSDPELFVVCDDVIIPPVCVEELGLQRIGTLVEEDPDYHPVYYDDGNIMVIGDGAAFEFTLPAVETPNQLYNSWLMANEILRQLLPDELNILTKAAYPFDMDYLLGRFDIPEKRLQWACRFGCDPQENAYTKMFSKEVDASQIVHRYAGGHFHISTREFDLTGKLSRPFIMLLDQTVGLLALFNSPYPEAEILRQEFYGVPGNFRRQNYDEFWSGVEYRTPSVSWLNSLDLIDQIFEVTERIIDLFATDFKRAKMLYAKYNEDARRAILNYDEKLGKELLETLVEY